MDGWMSLFAAAAAPLILLVVVVVVVVVQHPFFPFFKGRFKERDNGRIWGLDWIRCFFDAVCRATLQTYPPSLSPLPGVNLNLPKRSVLLIGIVIVIIVGSSS